MATTTATRPTTTTIKTTAKTTTTITTTTTFLGCDTIELHLVPFIFLSFSHRISNIVLRILDIIMIIL